MKAPLLLVCCLAVVSYTIEAKTFSRTDLGHLDLIVSPLEPLGFPFAKEERKTYRECVVAVLKKVIADSGERTIKCYDDVKIRIRKLTEKHVDYYQKNWKTHVAQIKQIAVECMTENHDLKDQATCVIIHITAIAVEIISDVDKLVAEARLEFESLSNDTKGCLQDMVWVSLTDLLSGVLKCLTSDACV